jgi:uncharacterized HhH-GPD family protein
MADLHLAQQEDADSLLSRDPLALLIGMLLDQQVPMERAFAGPWTIASRLGVTELDPEAIAQHDPDEFVALLSETPAVHRYPAAMAARVQKLAQAIVTDYDGDPEAIWRDCSDGRELLRRLKALPGFGKQKAQIFLALLAKQHGVTPTGWQEAAGPYGEKGSRRSVADVVDEESLAEVREFKKAQKAAAKASERP